MNLSQTHVDRLRAALDAAPTYDRAIGHMVEIDETAPRGYRCCLAGVFADVARLCGAPIELVLTASGAMFRSQNMLVWFDLETWYGLDLALVTVRTSSLPPGLRARIEAKVSQGRREQPRMELTDLFEHVHMRGFSLWRLSDYGVDFAELADALRWVLGIDRAVVLAHERRSVEGSTAQDAA